MKKTVLAIAAGFLLSGLGLTSASGVPPISDQRSAPSANVAGDSCHPYPAPVYTSTGVRVAHVVQRGDSNSARVSVSSIAGQKPQGSVTLTLSGRTSYSATREVHGGGATFQLPNDLRPGDYAVVATFTPSCGKWVGSTGAASFVVTGRSHHHGHHGHHHGHHHHGHGHHGHHHGHHHGGGHHHGHHDGGGHHHHHLV